MLRYKNVLAFMAHPDDELSCIGTLALLKEQGSNVDILVMAIPDLDRDGKEMNKREERAREYAASASVIGSDPWCLHMNEQTFTWTQQFVRDIDSNIERFNPDLIITQRTKDSQQTHSHLSNVCETLARKNRFSLWEMDQPLPGGWVTDGYKPNLLINITSVIDKKIQAIDAYRSQLKRYPGMKEALLNRDKYYAWMMNMEGESDVQYAEAFRIRKEIWV